MSLLDLFTCINTPEMINTGEKTNATILADNNAGEKELEENKEYWLIILFMITMVGKYDAHKLWTEFADEIKTKNRFFSQNKLLSKIEEISNQATRILAEGELLYRARDYQENDFLNNNIVKLLYTELKEIITELDFKEEDLLNDSVMLFASLSLLQNKDKAEEIKGALDKVENEMAPFYGFDRKGSNAPPSELATEGRANPRGISYLYCAQDIKTAIMELRPQMNKMYSIGTIILKRDARIFDFTYIPENQEEDNLMIYYELQAIADDFSKPNFGDTFEYLPTQFLCEYIRRLGFDGIRYKSSVSDGGINVLLFDTADNTRLYDVTGSSVYNVKTMDIEINSVLPM